MKRLVISVIVAMALVIIPVSGVLAATTAEVTVTAVPSYVGITIDNTAWTLNGISGSGLLAKDTTYYSQATLSETTAFGDPVLAANCWHTVTNDSSVNITLKGDMSVFSGGTDPMTNGNGTAGANAFAAWVCEADGVADWSTDKVVMDTTGSGTFWTSASPGDDIKVAFGVQTQTNAWDQADDQTTTILLTAAP
ncbi:hypothetical protein ES703_32965 [subsurface metagenome]